ncbi:MAG: hypothetical protein IJL06_08370 [Kiritimatiellae bacterium]|nr:hypothetical protein [Kiritimatiellia bacterium]
MVEFVKLVSSTEIRRDVPKSAVIDGKFVCGTLPEPYLNSQGWYRLVDTPMPTARDGYHYEFRFTYDDESAPTAILKNWVEVQDPPPPPRTFSKIKLKGAIAEAGLLDEFKAMLEQIEVKPGYTAAEAFADAVTLDEDHPDFKDAVARAQRELGIPTELVKRILAASVAE